MVTPASEERRSQRLVPYNQLYPSWQNKRTQLKRHEAIMRKQHGRLIGWSSPW
ncbi:hypothetical protein L873DRAFT_1811656 [Choiromyces venosus 120613-1]|uniref:Uncharacterized protein n=1 Tax=Choiromyces venosus 120613-1 TaxID=1336337 RepID=A0A3N4JR18_9PEZI|nr:hypothetical protein L873DRAFT_1811656 [Choiromyces venosus 120613-1]